MSAGLTSYCYSDPNKGRQRKRQMCWVKTHGVHILVVSTKTLSCLLRIIIRTDDHTYWCLLNAGYSKCSRNYQYSIVVYVDPNMVKFFLHSLSWPLLLLQTRMCVSLSKHLSDSLYMIHYWAQGSVQMV